MINIMKNKLLYLVIGICCIDFIACTHDSDELNPVVKNELSRSTITIERTVTLTTPGTLQEKVEAAMAGDDVSTLQKLTIIGPYNGKDVQYWKTALANLIEFDLKEAVPTQCVLGEGYEYLDPYENTMYQNDNVIGPHSFSFMKKLEVIVFPDCIEAIEYEACNGCTNLQSVTFGDNLKTIHNNAFSDCTLLDNVEFPSSLQEIFEYAFINTGVTSIIIPSSVTNLRWDIFNSCPQLESVKLLANIESIPNSMFYNCTKLESVELSSTIKEVGDNAFEYCISLKDYSPFININKINWYSFAHTGFEFVDLSNFDDSSNAINAFRECLSLKEVKLPDNLKSLPSGFIEGCSELKKINIPSAMETLSGFNGIGITELIIPNTVKNIGEYALSNNHALVSVILPEGLETIHGYAFSNTSLESIVIPESVDSIGYCCFLDCNRLKSVTLPSQLKVLPDGMFWSCDSLKTVVLPDELEKIEGGAFGDSGLESIEIPASVTTILDQAFRNCKLKSLEIPETVVNVTSKIVDWCQDIKYIIWDSPAEVGDVENFNYNCFLYIKDKLNTPSWKNVIIMENGKYVTESVSLCVGGQRDDANLTYYIPKEFTAKKITYERRFGDYDWQGEYWTYPGECSGWQTIVLPFTPTKIEHETKGEIAPFNSGIEGAKPFWLRELTADGWKDRTTMEPDKAYIIAMPNHESYMDEYRLYGKITFSAEDVTLEATVDETTQTEKVYPASVGPEYDLQPTYNYVKHGPLIYALNVTYRINNHHYGSLFARSSSDVYAFEAYVKPGGRLARSAFGIDTSSSNTRSAKEKNTTGIPQIGDM